MYRNYFNHTPQNEMRSFYLNKLATLGTIKNYKKNDHIDYFKNAKLSIIISGKVKVCIYTKSGLEKILFFLGPGEIYGEESLFYPHIDITPVPLMDTTISFISNEALKQHLINNPIDYRYLFQSILRKYEISLFQMGDALKKSPKIQISSTLYRMAIQQYDLSLELPATLSINITHEILANLIGCSRVTVTRVLKELRNEGILEVLNKQIIITDLIKLKLLSEL